MNFKIKDLEGFNISKGENTIDVYDELTRRIEEITYNGLIIKKNKGELVPGKYYRITDYVTTTAQEGTQSAGHQFDIIVLALDDHTLSDDAKAALHDGDTYFSGNNCKLESWELKYSFENNTVNFKWAEPDERILYVGEYSDYIYEDPEDPTSEIIGVDTTSYTGLSSTFFRYYITGALIEGDDTEYQFFMSNDSSKVLCLPVNIGPFDDTVGNNPGENPIIPSKVFDTEINELNKYQFPVVKIEFDGGKGVIYYMKDEWGNECPYDFKNIQFTRKMTDGEFDAANGVDTYVYTFTWVDETGNEPEIIDMSVLNRDLHGNNGTLELCLYDNEISNKGSFGGDGPVYELRNNVFICYAGDGYNSSYMTGKNYIGGDSHDNTFIGDANMNRLVCGCVNNVFYWSSRNDLTDCSYCTLGKNSRRNTIVNSRYITLNETNTDNRIYNSGTITFDKVATRQVEIDGCIGLILTTPMYTASENHNWLQNIKVLTGTNDSASNVKTIAHPTINDAGLTIYRGNNVREVTV